MANYYLDTNGVTAGFGTLTANWDTTTAVWTTANNGTTATAAVSTWSNADSINLGYTGITATAGILTMTANRSINGIYTNNIAAGQTVAIGANLLTMGGTSPTIDVSNAGGLTITSSGGYIDIAASGLTKSGAYPLTLTGNVVAVNNATFTNNSAGAVNWNVVSASIGISPSLAGTGTFAFNAGATGTTSFTGTNTLSGALNFNNLGAFTQTFSFAAASNVGSPSSSTFTTGTSSSTTVFTYGGSTSLSFAPTVFFNSSTAGTQVIRFEATAAGDLSVASTGLTKQNTNAGTLQLNATNTGRITLGPVSEASSGKAGVTKQGAGPATYIGPTSLGASAHSGNTTLTLGSLTLGEYATKDSTLDVTVTTGTTLILATNADRKFYVGGLTGALNIPLADAGSNVIELIIGSSNYAYTTSYSGAITGGGAAGTSAIRRIGTGSQQTFSATTTVHTFTGDINADAGTTIFGTTATAVNTLTQPHTFNIAPTADVRFYSTGTYTRNASDVFNLTNGGRLSIACSNTSGMIFPAGTLNIPTTIGYGLTLYTLTGIASSYVVANDMPAGLTYLPTVAGTQQFTYSGSTPARPVQVALNWDGAAVALTANFIANQSAGSVNISSVYGGTSTSAATFSVQGTTTGNTVGSILQGGSGAISFNKTGTGSWTITDTSNSATGTLSISTGTLINTNGQALATTSPLTVTSGASYKLGNASTSISDTHALATIGGTGTDGLGVIDNTYSQETLLFVNSIALSAATRLSGINVSLLTAGISGAFALTLDGSAAGSSMAIGYATNTVGTYTGATTIIGNVTIGSGGTAFLANGGTTSVLGSSTNVAGNLVLGDATNAGYLKLNYAGGGTSGLSTDRSFTVSAAGSASIEINNQTGGLVSSLVVSWTPATDIAFTSTNSAATINFYVNSGGDGSGLGSLIWGRAIKDNGTGKVALNLYGLTTTFSSFRFDVTPTFTGSIYWSSLGVTNNTGSTITIAGDVSFLNSTLTGTGNFQGINFTGTNATTALVIKDVTFNSQVAKSAGVAFAITPGTASNGVTKFTPPSGANDSLAGAVGVTGVSTSNRAKVQMVTETNVSSTGTGRVLGTATTTINAWGELQSMTGTIQRGRMRYGGNLTFNANSTLRIGG